MDLAQVSRAKRPQDSLLDSPKCPFRSRRRCGPSGRYHEGFSTSQSMFSLLIYFLNENAALTVEVSLWSQWFLLSHEEQ